MPERKKTKGLPRDSHLRDVEEESERDTSLALVFLIIALISNIVTLISLLGT